MPFDWTNFGSGMAQGGEDIAVNRLKQTPLGQGYGAIAPLLSQGGFGGQQSQQTDPQQASINHFTSNQQQATDVQPLVSAPPDDQPLSFDTSAAKHSDAMAKVAKVASIVAAFA